MPQLFEERDNIYHYLPLEKMFSFNWPKLQAVFRQGFTKICLAYLTQQNKSSLIRVRDRYE